MLREVVIWGDDGFEDVVETKIARFMLEPTYSTQQNHSRPLFSDAAGLHVAKEVIFPFRSRPTWLPLGSS